MGAPLVMRGRWTDGRNQEHRITRTKNRSHRAAPRIGVVWNHVGIRFTRMGSLGRRRAVRCLFRRRRQLAARAVGGATFSIGLVGVSIAAVFASHIVALSHGGASAAQSRNGRARSSWAGCSGAGAIIRSSLSVTRVVGLVSNGALRSPG